MPFTDRLARVENRPQQRSAEPHGPSHSKFGTCEVRFPLLSCVAWSRRTGSQRAAVRTLQARVMHVRQTTSRTSRHRIGRGKPDASLYHSDRERQHPREPFQGLMADHAVVCSVRGALRAQPGSAGYRAGRRTLTTDPGRGLEPRPTEPHPRYETVSQMVLNMRPVYAQRFSKPERSPD